MRPRVDRTDTRFAVFRACAQAAARDPRVRALACRLAGIGDLSPSLEDARALACYSAPELRREQCARLLRAVQSRVRYVEGPFVAPLPTWRTGRGDCKSSAVLLCALALAIGCDARLVAMGWKGEPQHVACQLRPPGAPGWLWAETTLPASLGEHPSDALERSDSSDRADLSPRARGCIGRVGRVDAARKAAHAYGGHVLALAFESVVGRAPSLFERQLLQAIAWTETSYGRGWSGACKDSRNWGSMHATGNAPSCPWTDSYPDGTSYTQPMVVYPDDVSGAADVVRLIYQHMPGVRRVLESAAGVAPFAREMIFSHYAGSFCPIATARYGAAVRDATQFRRVGERATTAAGKACEEEAIATYQRTIRRAVDEIADALGEPRPADSSSSVLPWLVAGGAVFAAGATVLATHPDGARRLASRIRKELAA